MKSPLRFLLSLGTASILLFCTTGLLRAQDAPPSPTTAPASPTTAPYIVCEPLEGKNPDEKVGPIVMGQMKISQVLDLLRNYSGRVILPGEGLPDVKLTFNSGGKLPRKDAIAALENLLALNGVALRLLDNGFVRAIPSTHPDNSGAPLIEDIPANASSEQIYSKLFRLQYFDSGTAFHRIRGLLSTGNRSALENQPEINALLVTDSLMNLERIGKILNALDQPQESRFELYTFPIKHGSAWNIRRMAYQVFRTEMNNRLRQSMVYVDRRTNKLLVVTHPSNYDFFANLVEELDKEVAPFTTTEVIKIEQGNYWSIWRTIHGIVRHQQSQFARRGFVSGEEREDRDAARLSVGGEAESTGEATVEDSPETGIAPAQPADPGATADAVMVEEGPPELQFSPYVGLYADPSNNAIVVYGTKSDVARIRSLVKQLDIKRAPYVKAEVFDIQFARASDIRNVIEYTINIQRENFGRQGLTSGEMPAPDAESAAADSEQGFEYSNFVATIADNRNNTILVQGTQRDINQVQNLIEKLDVESAPLTANEVIYLEHAQAQTLARVIQNIINYQRWMFARNRAQSQAAAEAGDGMASPEIGFEFSDYAVVNADRRTNALFVYGTQQDIKRVKDIVAESDIPVEPMTNTQVMPLTHTDATQTAALINRVVAGQVRSLRQVRSESREVANPAARDQGVQFQASESAGVVEGDEALQFSSFVSVTPDRRSNSLIVYGTHSDIRQVRELLVQVDIEVAPLTTSEVFLLQNTQARSLYGVLINVVRGQERALRQVRSSIREIRNIRPDDPEAANAELSLEALQFSPYVTITPNDRNNSIIVYGTSSDIAQLSEIIEVSDIEIAPKTQSRTFFIRHADANDVASTISSLISQQQRVRERERTLTRVFRRDGSENGENGDDGGMPQEDFADMGSGNNPPEVLTESSTQVYNDLFSFDEDLQFSPYVSLVADDRSNSVLAYGTEFDLDQIAELIKQIDDVLPQVRIEVVIAEVILHNDQVSGLESFGLSYNLDGDNETRGNTQAPAVRPEEGGEPSFDMGFSLNNFSLNTIFRVAKEDNKVKVLSAPSVTTTHNRLATINVGEARPIITSSASNLNNPDLVTRSTVEYRDIGITLRVRPLVSNRGFIQMDLEQIVETVIDTQTIDNNQQPIISTRRASSFLSVRDREVIVLGGLQQVDIRDSDGSVFLLGDLPVLGSLFRPKNSQQVVRELVIFIKPYIVESLRESELITKEELDRTAVGEDIEYFLEKGRFQEQERLLEKEEEDPNAESNEAEASLPAPSIPPPAGKAGAPVAEPPAATGPEPEVSANEGEEDEPPRTKSFFRKGPRR